MFEIIDHPDIRRVMRTGRPTADDGLTYRCPVCGAELEADETIYTATIYGKEKVIGCAECVEVRTAEGIYA
jgi:phosphodiesterase/alkaline phosphatase D-like protein